MTKQKIVNQKTLSSFDFSLFSSCAVSGLVNALKVQHRKYLDLDDDNLSRISMTAHSNKVAKEKFTSDFIRSLGGGSFFARVRRRLSDMIKQTRDIPRFGLEVEC